MLTVKGNLALLTLVEQLRESLHEELHLADYKVTDRVLSLSQELDALITVCARIDVADSIKKI